MLFKDIVGQEFIINHLTTSADGGRIAHAQLFVGPPGRGVLPTAIAYAQYLICQNSNGENENGNAACNLKFQQMAHPDLHFAFPVTTTEEVKTHAVSAKFGKEWREFLTKNPYGTLFEWYRHLGVENKQGQIGVDEAQDILKSLSLKAYEGGLKVLIVWMAEKMNTATANKLLKLVEEPPDKTVIILVAENEENIIQTIRSRCQILHFPPMGEAYIQEELIKNEDVPLAEAKRIAHQCQGDYNTALHILHRDGDEEQFETWFVTWVRTAFKAKGNKKSILDLIAWAESIASKGRETQKNFLSYCVDFFRQAMLLNYKADNLVYLQPVTKFELAKFAPFVHGNNILEITKELEDAAYHIERNGNAKIILTDLSIKLTRLLHKKQ